MAQYKANTVDVNGNVYDTVGENIREGGKLIKSDIYNAFMGVGVNAFSAEELKNIFERNPGILTLEEVANYLAGDANNPIDTATKRSIFSYLVMALQTSLPFKVTFTPSASYKVGSLLSADNLVTVNVQDAPSTPEASTWLQFTVQLVKRVLLGGDTTNPETCGYEYIYLGRYIPFSVDQGMDRVDYVFQAGDVGTGEYAVEVMAGNYLKIMSEWKTITVTE